MNNLMKLNLAQAGQVDTVGLVAHYKLWTGLAGTTVFDYSLNGAAGTPAGTDISPVYPGFSFNGTDDTINVGDLDALVGSVLSVALWVNNADVAGQEFPLGLNAVTDFINIDTGVVKITGFGAESLFVDGIAGTAGVTTIDATWHHLVISAGGAMTANAVEIGSALGTVAFYEGLIGEVMIFNTTKTAAQAKSLFETTRSRYGV